MSEPYDDIQDMLGSGEQDFLEDQYGCYENFMASYGLKPWEDDDMDVGFELIHQFAEERQDANQPPPLEEIPRDIKQEGNVSEVKAESQASQMDVEEDASRPTRSSSSPFVLRPLTPSSNLNKQSNMPATNALQPPLTNKERKILKSGFGDWTNFCASYGLKPWDRDDAAEAKAILEAMARQGEE
ncbi:hypothetical protein JCM10020v2_001826 [Rhodotorula toruloides]